MYDYIVGDITDIQPTYLVLENNGIGYVVYVANPYHFSSLLNKTTKLYLFQHVREDAHLLYGFESFDERAIFQKLISVSGIGPKSGLAILAGGDANKLARAIEEEDTKYLMSFPGVGKKTAGQLILDLKGKMLEFLDGETSPVSPAQATNPIAEEAALALEGLGYSTREIGRAQKALENETIETTEDYLRQAFKVLIK